MEDASSDALLGQIFAGRYLLEERLGDGSTGVVYRAKHVKLERRFAIKVLHGHLFSDEKVVRRFDREAEVAAKLHHKNVVGVVDIGKTPAGARYIVMELAVGEPLSAIISRGPMPTTRIVPLMQQLCDGLQHAHDAGLIHRDFKPENVIVECDRDGVDTPRIIDFGLAISDETSTGERERLTTAGLVLGTPQYMAPENAGGGKVDHRIDLFALGVMCFELVTGKLPFDGDGVDVARANMMFDTPGMGVRAPHLEVDPLLEVFTRRLMARSRSRRIQTARAAREILDLIARDRHAAAAAMGFELPDALVAAPDALVAAPSPRAAAVMPTLTTRPRAPNTSAPGTSTSTVLIQSNVPHAIDQELDHQQDLELTALIARGRSRVVLAGIAAGVLVMLAVATFIVRRAQRSDPAAPIAPIATIAPVATIAEPSPPTPTSPPPLPAATELPAPPVATIAVSPPLPPLASSKPVVRKPVAPPPVEQAPVHIAAEPPRVEVAPAVASPPPATAAAPDAIPGAAALAKDYAAVGRALAQLEKTRGQPSTFDLWPRYRRIRINAALANPRDRQDISALLADLQREIAARAK
ncbi:MAG: protein kinase [Deltaproteobacteria bacterium]|nr:protein kinase [Deltaproteobacteria bacterium]MDQ3299201.1 protein kinase [Myxococcota bacterium]